MVTCSKLYSQIVPLSSDDWMAAGVSQVTTVISKTSQCSQQITCVNDNMITASFATQVSNDTCGSQAMAELLLLALLPIANDRMRGAASEKEYDDALREGVR